MEKSLRKQSALALVLMGALFAVTLLTTPAQSAHAANTTMGNATKMTQGVTYSTTLGYDRYYRIDVPSDGILTLTFGKKADGLDNASHNGHDVTINRYESGSTKTVLKDISALVKSSVDHISTPIGIKKGTYFLKISECYWQGSKCTETLKYSFSTNSNWEKEDNNTPSTATKIKLSQTLSGNLPTATDEDWYRISVPQTGWYSYNFSRNYNKDGYRWVNCWYSNLYKTTDGSFSNDLLKGIYIHSDATGTKSRQVKLSKGDYYICVSSNGFEDQPKYSISLNKVASPTATKISKSKSGKKSFKVYWSKKSGTSKYEIRVSTKKNMSGSHYYSVGKSRSSLNVKKLVSKKWYEADKPLKRHTKYYVQVRTVKTLTTPDLYQSTNPYDWKSSWSKVKTVNTK